MEIENSIFKIGDVVTLKTDANYRGVIINFGPDPKGTSVLKPYNMTEISTTNSRIWATVSFLDREFKEKISVIRIVHLKLFEQH